MRPFLPLVLLVANGLLAQGVLSTHYGTTCSISSWNAGVYFDLTAHTALTLDRIDLNLASPPGTLGQLEVHVRPGTWAGHGEENIDWVRVAGGDLTAAGSGLPTPCKLTRPLGLPPGDYGVALHVIGVEPALVSYPRSFSTPDLELMAGGAAPKFLASAPVTICVFSGALHYTLGGGPFFLAQVDTFGHGCIPSARSFYESFAPDQFDLGNSRLLLTPNALGGYDVSRTHAPEPTLPVNATNLGLVRGAARFVPLPTPLSFPGGVTSKLLVFADGHVTLNDRGLLSAPSNPPSATALFAHLPTMAVAWQNLDPSGTRNVHSSVDPATGAVTITWWKIPVHRRSGKGNTFALTVHPSGILELHYGAFAGPVGQCVVGFGPGVGSLDPGPRDLTVMPFFETRHDSAGLTLVTRGRPVLGTETTFVVAGVHRPTLLCTLGFARRRAAPAIDLEPFGAPGCQLLLDPASAVWQALPGTLAAKLPIPRRSSLLGVTLRAQAAAWQPSANALGLVTSQGVRLVLGSL